MKRKYASQFINEAQVDRIENVDDQEDESVASPIINLEAQQNKHGLTVHAHEYSA